MTQIITCTGAASCIAPLHIHGCHADTEPGHCDQPAHHEAETPRHEEHETVEAWSADCFEGECEHIDESGQPEDLSNCPSKMMEVCVDCMVELGHSRNPAEWEGTFMAWPTIPVQRRAQFRWSCSSRSRSEDSFEGV